VFLTYEGYWLKGTQDKNSIELKSVPRLIRFNCMVWSKE